MANIILRRRLPIPPRGLQRTLIHCATLRLTGTKIGCGGGAAAFAVLVEDQPVKSCLYPVKAAEQCSPRLRAAASPPRQPASAARGFRCLWRDTVRFLYARANNQRLRLPFEAPGPGLRSLESRAQGCALPLRRLRVNSPGSPGWRSSDARRRSPAPSTNQPDVNRNPSNRHPASQTRRECES